MTLRGSCAVITGSTQGLGLVAAHRFAAAGCHVVLNGLVAPTDGSRIGEEIEARHGVRTRFCAADLRRPVEMARMIASAEETFGSVDILVNNAVVRHTAPVEEFPSESWDEGIAVNLSAAFHLIRLVVPGMRRRNHGRIVNVSSIYGLTGAANRVAYVTTKTGLVGLTRAIALELAGTRVTCNAVCPGTVLTPVHEESVQRLMIAERLSREAAERRFLTGKQPTGRFVSADQVAALMVFLCGPDSGEITGAALPVDGGWSAG